MATWDTTISVNVGTYPVRFIISINAILHDRKTIEYSCLTVYANYSVAQCTSTLEEFPRAEAGHHPWTPL
jgi:hypothetical protein